MKEWTPRVLAALLGTALTLLPGAAGSQAGAADGFADFSATERAMVIAHGPWPPPPSLDPSNRFSGLPAAIAPGQQLFAEPRLSGSGVIACASCHDPVRDFTDGRARAIGAGAGERNTQGLMNVDLQRWFGWDGGSDSLWAATVRPLLAAHEMASSPARIAAVIREDAGLSRQLDRIRADHPRPNSGPRPTGAPEAGAEHAITAPSKGTDEALMVDAAKAIAAYLETLRSPRTAFDAFRDALASGDAQAAGRYPAAARRGLKLFTGRGNCSVCHFGPGFSNGEFHDIGIPFMVAPGRVDPGRHGGVQRVRTDRYNLLGAFNDQPQDNSNPSAGVALKTRTVTPLHRNFGEWRTPGLRGLVASAPYMHDGRLATLADVIGHYDSLNEDRLHADGESLLRPLRLSASERDDLLAFLRSLSP